VTDRERNCEIDVSALGLSGSRYEVWTLTGPSLDAVNSFVEKERVAPREEQRFLPGGAFSHSFPARSVSVLRFR
jgi:alpha-L-arabinofuranosidase